MVRIILTIIAFIILSMQALAADLTAMPSSSQVGVGEAFTLKLSLSGAKEKDSPDISPLKKDFSVYSQSQFSNITIINGKMQNNKGWQYTLSAKKTGKLIIPAVSINTDKGLIQSRPVNITVTTATKADTNNKSTQTAAVEASVSEHSPYVNESIVLTVSVNSNANVRDLSLEPMDIPGVLVEKMDDQQSGNEVKFILTPLKEGQIQIPAPVLRGKVRVASSGNRSALDPFGMFDNDSFFSGSIFGNYRDFSVSGKPITLNVRPPASKIQPWLPLHSLSIQEKWDNNQKFKQGEPIYRAIEILAKGTAGNQLPELKNKIATEDFKVYTDKPETQDRVLPGENYISGWKKETFTIIPQKAGNFTLPEIKIPWWNVDKNGVEYAVLPARTISVAKGEYTATENIPAIPVASTTKKTPAIQIKTSANNPQLSIAIGILTLVIIIMAGWIVYLYRKIANLSRQKQITVEKPDIALPSINSITEARELAKYVQIYAQKHWNMQPGIPLQAIASTLNDGKLAELLMQLDAALYAGKNLDIQDWKQEWKEISSKIKVKQQHKAQKETFATLNP